MSRKFHGVAETSATRLTFCAITAVSQKFTTLQGCRATRLDVSPTLVRAPATASGETWTVSQERPRWESPVEKAIREAQERGEFDDLPGAGKPLKDLGDTDDPMWWLRRYAEREELDLSATLPPALQLRKEAAGFPESLTDLRTEESVRHVLDDFNHRVRRDRLRPPGPGMPQLLAPTA